MVERNDQYAPGDHPRRWDRVLKSRRTFTALFSITCLTILGLSNNIDTSLAIASVAAAVAGANAYQKSRIDDGPK